MKPLLAWAMVLTVGAVLHGAAEAKPAPVAPPRLTLAPDEYGLSVGPVGAVLESDYFRAPQTSVASQRVFPCRLHLQVFDKTQLAQSCR